MKYINPIVPGFHPDPSVCKVGEDFYLVNSTFEYFPGIPVYHSKDLIHWEQAGHVITRNSQVTLPKGAPNCIAIYAPTIRYNNGTFYCIVTNVGSEGNVIFSTRDIYGEWSDPVHVSGCGGIDPSLFFDDDGKVYYSGIEGKIFICEIDVNTGKTGEKHYVWNGSGGNNPEGPHIYKINGYYYLLIAEGGTEAGHMVTIARSRELFGNYEACPSNPILTNRGTDLPIKAIGHADIVEDTNGNWHAVCLGNRPLGYPFTHNLGRETFLTSFTWENGWPVMDNDGHVLEEMEGNFECCKFNSVSEDGFNENGRYVPGADVTDTFMGKALHPSWNYIYNQTENGIYLSEDGLVLSCMKPSLSEDEEKAILLRRQEHFSFEAGAVLSFNPKAPGEEAGITVYMNPMHHYEAYIGYKDGVRKVFLRRRIGSLIAVENEVAIGDGDVELIITADKANYSFSVKNGTENVFLGKGECRYLTTEVGGCFTGNYIGLFATSCGKESDNKALCSRFSYSAVLTKEK